MTGSAVGGMIAPMTTTSPSTQFTAAGKPVRCTHCGGQEFDRRDVLMNTRGATFFNLDWLNRKAVALACRQCGRIEWFAKVDEPGS